MTYQSGIADDVRSAFSQNGKLANAKDPNFRAISDNWPVFGFSHDLGSVQDTVSTLFTIGLAQENAIQYSGASKDPHAEPSLWKSYFSTGTDAVSITPMGLLLCGPQLTIIPVGLFPS